MAMMLRTGKLNCGCDDETADALDGNVTDLAPRRTMLVAKVAHWRAFVNRRTPPRAAEGGRRRLFESLQGSVVWILLLTRGLRRAYILATKRRPSIATNLSEMKPRML